MLSLYINASEKNAGELDIYGMQLFPDYTYYCLQTQRSEPWLDALSKVSGESGLYVNLAERYSI